MLCNPSQWGLDCHSQGHPQPGTRCTSFLSVSLRHIPRSGISCLFQKTAVSALDPVLSGGPPAAQRAGSCGGRQPGCIQKGAGQYSQDRALSQGPVCDRFRPCQRRGCPGSHRSSGQIHHRDPGMRNRPGISPRQQPAVFPNAERSPDSQ